MQVLAQRIQCSSLAGRPCGGQVRLVPLSTAQSSGASTTSSKLPYPSYEEERDASHEAFMKAFMSSKPQPARVPGLQQFAAALWERRRRIPSQLYTDPLQHVFVEFDVAGTGSLTAEGVSKALGAYNITVSPEAVQAFIDATDQNCNGTIERDEFAAFIFHMASGDLQPAEGVKCVLPPRPKPSRDSSMSTSVTVSSSRDEGSTSSDEQH